MTTTVGVPNDEGCPPAAAGNTGSSPLLLDSEGSMGRIGMPVEEMNKIAYSGYPASALNVD